MSWQYPIDTDWFLNRVRERGGDDVLSRLGIREEDPLHVKLNRVILEHSRGWFPRRASGEWHGGVDIGLSESTFNLEGQMEIRAIADGRVVGRNRVGATYEVTPAGGGDPIQCSAEVLIIRHEKDGSQVYALYMHLRDRLVIEGEDVQAGQRIATLGYHGGFSNLHLAIVSKAQLGGRDMEPEATREEALEEDIQHSVRFRRIRVDSLGPIWGDLVNEEGPWYYYDPIFFVAWAAGENLEQDVGAAGPPPSPELVPSTPSESPPDEPTTQPVNLLTCEELRDCQELRELSLDPSRSAIQRDHGNSDTVKAIQKALKRVGMDLGRFVDRSEPRSQRIPGVDGDYGETSERAVRRFQEQNADRSEVTDGLGQAAQRLGLQGETALQANGQVDWATLIGLDIVANSRPPLSQPQDAGGAPAVAPGSNPDHNRSDAPQTDETPPFPPGEPKVWTPAEKFQHFLDRALCCFGDRTVRYAMGLAKFEHNYWILLYSWALYRGLPSDSSSNSSALRRFVTHGWSCCTMSGYFLAFWFNLNEGFTRSLLTGSNPQVYHYSRGGCAGHGCNQDHNDYRGTAGLFEYNQPVENTAENRRWGRHPWWTFRELLNPPEDPPWRSRLNAVTLLKQCTHRVEDPEEYGREYHPWGHIRLLIRIDEEHGLWPIHDRRGSGEQLEAGLYVMEATGFKRSGSTPTYSYSRFKLERIDNNSTYTSSRSRKSCGLRSIDHPFCLYTFEPLTSEGRAPQITREGSAGTLHDNPSYEIRFEHLEHVSGVPTIDDVQQAVSDRRAPFRDLSGLQRRWS
jgi:peptidoglycan hydrolase-like protein with peptidoglycan-binding domain